MENILIADDHVVARRGIREILREAFSAAHVAEASDAADVLAQLPARPWDIILLDILMPGMGVLELLAKIRETNTEVPILILTGLTEPEYVVQTMKAGANGLIHKHRAADDLLEAIERVGAGGSYLHSETAIEVADALRESARPPPHQRLSERELEVFRLIAVGRAVKEVAADLNLSDKTVATYLARIREKTGLSSHVEIARYALRHGLVE